MRREHGRGVIYLEGPRGQSQGVNSRLTCPFMFRTQCVRNLTLLHQVGLLLSLGELLFLTRLNGKTEIFKSWHSGWIDVSMDTSQEKTVQGL